MCPACLTTLALLAAGTGTAGGLTAFVARKLAGRGRAKAEDPKPHEGAPPPEEKSS